MELMHRTSRVVAVWSVFLLPLVWLIFGGRAAVGVGSGIGWALANALITAKLVTSVLDQQRLAWWQWATLWGVKLPLLYGLLVWCVVSPWGSPIGFLAGFSIWFIGIISVGVSRMASKESDGVVCSRVGV